MASSPSVFACTHCDTQYPKWQGQCGECGKWGTIRSSEEEGAHPRAVVRVQANSAYKKITLGNHEIENVLGGGVVPGSLILLAGDPGIGKSTLVLHIADAVSRHGPGEVIYVCGEESPEQIGARLMRLGCDAKHMAFIVDTDISAAIAHAEKAKPALLIVDSIQTVFSSDIEGEQGGINQIRAVTARLLQFSKTHNIPVLIVGHVTKEGAVAGPRMLEHMVDVVLYLEGDRFHQHRLLRCVKNRFGPTNQVGVFSLDEKGMRPVSNPSEMFLSTANERISGSVVSVIMEGSRPFLVEIQALTNKTNFSSPKRAASGFDVSRLELLIAVLERRAGLALSHQDVFLNVVGGLKVKDPALDLAVCLAIASSLASQPLPERAIVLGEVGLGGEVRPISHPSLRIGEARRIGYANAYAPASGVENKNTIPINSVGQALEVLLTIHI